MTEPVLNNAFETDQMRGAAAAGLATIDAPPIEVTPIHRGNRKLTAIARFGRREPVVVQTRFAVDWLQRDGGRRIRAGAVLARVYAITAGMPR